MPTIGDVAQRAGVSVVTVSRVINDANNVSPATRERVERAIKDLGYVPNVVARSLRSKRTRSLALLVPDITNVFWTTVARGVEDAAQSRNYSVLLCNTDENPAKQRRYLDVVASQRVDGVIISPSDSDIRNIAQLRDRTIPTVIIDRRVEGWDVDTVCGDSISGARALVQHLISLGHRRIGLISGPQTTSTAEDRVAGYSIALAEAGIPLDPRLIRRGEYRDVSGERLAGELLDDGLGITAIFAANNVIAMGVIAALEKRGLRVPQDIALVSFDDLPDASRLFPFLTVVEQSAHDMGLHAAQLLLSRLEAEVTLQPRHVVLPTRMIVRYSCGAKQAGGNGALSLPLPRGIQGASVLVKPLRPEEQRSFAAWINGCVAPNRVGEAWLSGDGKPDVGRLLTALRHQEPSRVPHLEFWVTSKAVYEYVLERELRYDIVDARIGGQSIAPEDDVEFAQRLGMDAVACNFSWRPNNIFRRASDGTEHYVGGSVRGWADLDHLEPPPSPLDQLNYLERYLRAAQGTGVGVIANFTSFFDSTLLAIGMQDALCLFRDNRVFLETLMDILLAHQERAVRAVCDRFADELAFVLVNDDITYNHGLLIHPDLFHEIFPQRMRRLIAPAKEHGKLVAMHSDGRVEEVLPLLYDIGFSALHPIQPECNDIFALKERWAGRLALIGNIPTLLLAHGTKEEIEEQVREHCLRLAPGGGYVLASSTSIMQGIPPENFVAMTRAVHRYGRYGALGRDV